MQVDLLIFHGAPEALDEYVVAPCRFSIHAYRDDPLSQQDAGEGVARELPEFNRLSQQPCGLIEGTRQTPQPVSSNQGSCAAWC